jgi:hypothetical protein
MRRTIQITLAILVLWSLALPAAAYQVTAGHPRLFFTAAEVPALRARCTGALATDYNDLKSWCDSNLSASLPLASIDFYEDHLAAYSFVYLMSQNTTYAARAKTIAQYATSQNYSGDPTYTRGMALFFDWCYGTLSASERQTFGAAIAQSGLAYMATENWTAMNNYHSKLSRLREFAYAGLAVYGEGINDSAAVTLCNMFREHTFGSQNTIACVDEIAEDGAYFEGDYTTTVLADCFREGCWIWDKATDDDPFVDSKNLDKLATYYLYETFAKNGPGAGAAMSGSKQGDSESHTLGSATVRLVMYSLANKYRDGKAQWLADQIATVGLGYINRPDRWLLIIYKDPSVTAQAPTGLLPSSWCFRDMGTTYMRSGWDLSEASTDVYAVFRCEKLAAGHTNAHQNHFLIARGNDLLAIDSGVYDGGISSHHLNYFERTIAHNTITVMNPSETTFSPYANDGGQIMPSSHELPTHYGDASQPLYQRGEITAYEDSDTFAYTKGDATAAYAPGKVDLFTREFVYVKPDIFVILDRVKATSPTYKKRWLLHTVNEPVVNGDTFTVTQGGSRMFVKSLLPGFRDVVKVGGPGHQFDVNGTNYPPAEAWTEDMGAWRLEVSPSLPSAEDLFLTVIYVTSASTTTMPDVEYIQGNQMIGARVGSHVVMFSATGAVVQSATYEYGH